MLKQYTTFYIEDNLYGIDVMEVQEITKEVNITPVQLAPFQVSGLINLRGRVATAVALGKVFNEDYKEDENFMTIVCEYNEELYSFLVDRVGDVLSFEDSEISKVPGKSEEVDIIKGIYQLDNSLLRIIEPNSIVEKLKINTRGDAA